MKHFITLLAALFVIAGCGGAETVKISSKDAKIATQTGTRDQAGNLLSSGKPGYFVYGPYMKLEAGKYRLVAKGSLVASDAAAPIGTIDAVAKIGKLVMGKKEITAQEQENGKIVTFEFSLASDVADAEFRIFVNDKVTGSFAGYELTKIGKAGE